MGRVKKHDSIDNYGVEYKKIPGCDFEYYITSDGRVWTNNRKNGIERFMKLQEQDGYLSVGLMIGGKQVLKRVHRLVAESFIPNPSNKPYINHIDGSRNNNNVENLEWCTQKENVQHSIRVLGRWSNSVKQRESASKQGKNNRKLTMEEANNIRKDYSTGLFSQKELGNIYGISRRGIHGIVTNKSYTEV